jgi:hypothetical protein
MGIDYKAISDSDPGGALEAAYNTMLAMTMETTPDKLVTYRNIAAGVNLAASSELESAIEASALPKWVDKALNGDGININDPQVSAVLSTLVSAETYTAISDLGRVASPLFPRLKIGHLANARQMKSSGRI